jgi:hypothetical protein
MQKKKKKKKKSINANQVKMSNYLQDHLLILVAK